MSLFMRIAQEPPFRLLAYFIVKRLCQNVEQIDRWGTVDRPNYFAGVLAAARLAAASGITNISVAEFGVAGGNGLVNLQKYSEIIEKQTGVSIQVFGFDTGEGLPSLCSDYRDHPDKWMRGDFKMNIPKLNARLSTRTRLYMGNIANTLPEFVRNDHPPLGFIACDVDLYSSTTDVLKILSIPERKILRRVFMYFDDIDCVYNHRFAGEWLAIEEFNQNNTLIKIDLWRDIKKERVFSDAPWLEKMFIAHDLDAINKYKSERDPSTVGALN